MGRRTGRAGWAGLLLAAGLAAGVPWAGSAAAQPPGPPRQPGPPPAPAPKETLVDVIPATAKAVLLVPNVEKAIGDYQVFTEQAGLPVLRPGLDELSALLNPISADWIPARGVGVALFELGSDSLALVFPSSSPAKAVTRYGAGKEGEYHRLSLHGTDFLTLATEEHVVLARTPEILAKFQAKGPRLASLMNGEQRQLAAKSGFFAFANLRPSLATAEAAMALAEFLPDDQIRKRAAELGKGLPLVGRTPPAQLRQLLRQVRLLSQRLGAAHVALSVGQGVTAELGVAWTAKAAPVAPAKPDWAAALPPKPFLAALAIDLPAPATPPLGLFPVSGGTLAASAPVSGSVLSLTLRSPDPKDATSTLRGLVGVAQVLAQNATEDKVRFAASVRQVGPALLDSYAVEPVNPSPAYRDLLARFGGKAWQAQVGEVPGQGVGLTVSTRLDAFADLAAAGDAAKRAELAEPALRMLPAAPVAVLLFDPVACMAAARDLALLPEAMQADYAKRRFPAEAAPLSALGLTLGTEGASLRLALPPKSVRALLDVVGAPIE